MNGSIVHAPLYSRQTICERTSIATRALFTLRVWQRRHAERVHLARLEPRLIADMGLTAAEVAGEAAKPFWRA